MKSDARQRVPQLTSTMAPRRKKDDSEELDIDEPPSIDPYEVLGLSNDAKADQIKSAYRRLALKHHPDKATDKEAAHTKFQEIAFAYAILSDDRRRKRYDLTGRTDELVDDDETFDWASFYREQYKDVISEASIQAFAKTYKGSEEEREHVLSAYTSVKGRMAKFYELVMLSDPEEEDRFRAIIDAAVIDGEVESYPAYANETEKARTKRLRDAKKAASKEAKEAEEHGKKNDLGELVALIQQRQKGRESFLDRLEEKYGGKRQADGPPESAFAEMGQRKKKSKK